ncbi:2-oxoglutarate and iron-dependent oxygenase domain-containing protein [Micromonospora chersina]|uniref:2-oxoglutarate and iron-dependent oxygenase domain-containing protein n=1 Tax=Micromonospora chersina TaxID=47854 RepID=UPI0033ADEF0D
MLRSDFTDISGCMSPKRGVKGARQKSTVDRVPAILDRGYALLELNDEQADRLARALGAGRAFFALPADRKTQHASADMNHGYRPLGREFSITPDRPDLNECFTIWHDRLDLIPRSADLPELTEAWGRWRDSLVEMVDGSLRSLPGTSAAIAAPTFAPPRTCR